MRKKAFFIMVLSVILGCSSSKNEQKSTESISHSDSIQKTEEVGEVTAESTAAEAKAREDKAITFITDMYNNKKYEDENFLMSHCSEEVLKKLRDDYEYDDGDGGLASWDFRSGEQDGPNDKHQIISVTQDGNGWYMYEFYDMGIRGSHSIKIVANGDDFMIEGLK